MRAKTVSVEAQSPQSTLDLFRSFLEDCFWLLLNTVRRPSSLGSDAAPSSQVTGLFVTAAASLVATALQIFKASTPAVVSWSSGNSTVFIATLREWSNLQSGDHSFASIASMAAWTAIFVVVAALSMTLVLSVVQFRWFQRIEFGEVLKRSAILVSIAIMLMVLSEAVFPSIAESRASGWIVAVVAGIVVFVVPLYVLLCVPYFVWKSAFRLSRLLVAAAVVLSWPLALLVVDRIPTDYFFPETRIDSVLSAQLQNMIRLAGLGQTRNALEIAHQAASSYDDSIQLDSLTLSLLLKAFNHAVTPRSALDTAAENDKEWAGDIKSRYLELAQATDLFQRKYSDVPGMLLKVARAQLESGQCEKAEVLFEAVYHHRHAVLIERLFAGMYLRGMDREPDDMKSLLARFGPSDDWTFFRSLLASPGVGLGIFQSDRNTNASRLTDLHKSANEVFLRTSKWRCNFAGNAVSAKAAAPPNTSHSD